MGKGIIVKSLREYETLFNGILGDFKMPPVSLEVKENKQFTHSKAFLIPKIHIGTLKKEIQHLVELGVLKNAQIQLGHLQPLLYPRKIKL
eukprot:10827449-Ditylum_brightwellii.AAC.1